MKKRIYIGINRSDREIFRSLLQPTEQSHGSQYHACIGPFRTLRAALFMIRPGQRNNPHVQCVNDAERIAARIA